MSEPIDQDDDEKARDWSFLDGHWGFMYPEILLGPALLIASPIWLASLVRQGAYGAAACLAVGAGVGGIIMTVSFKRRSHSILYVALLALVATGALTFKLVGH